MRTSTTQISATARNCAQISYYITCVFNAQYIQELSTSNDGHLLFFICGDYCQSNSCYLVYRSGSKYRLLSKMAVHLVMLIEKHVLLLLYV